MSSKSIVTDKDGGAVVLGGSVNGGWALDSLYYLPHANADEWILMDQKLSDVGFPAEGVAFLVPDDACQPI